MPRWVLPVAVLLFAAVATPREPWSWHARVVTAGVILAILVLALARGRHRRAEPPPRIGRPPTPRLMGYVGWALLLGAFFVHQMSMFFASPRDVYPTMSSLWNIALEPYPVRVAAMAAWILFGVFLVRRVPVGDDAAGPPRWRPVGSALAREEVRR